MKKKFDMLPASIKKKIDAGKSLTVVDQEIIRGLEEAKYALELPRDKRRPFEFKEEHELLMTFDGEFNLNDYVDTDDDSNGAKAKEYDVDANEDEVDPEPEVKRAPARKKTKKKKQPKQTVSQEDPATTPAKESNKTTGHVGGTDFVQREEEDESDHNIDYNDDHHEDDDEEDEVVSRCTV